MDTIVSGASPRLRLPDGSHAVRLPSALQLVRGHVTGTRLAMGYDLGLRDPGFIQLLQRVVEPFLRHYFRAEVRGGENIPAHGPALLVGNHSGGTAPMDMFLVLDTVVKRFGVQRELYGLAHDMVLELPILSTYLVKAGALRACHLAATRALESGALVLVFPGGDHDTLRPWRDRNRVVLAHRTGFIKLALQTRVPIIPVVTAGAQEVWIPLGWGEVLPRVLGLKRWARINVLPLSFMVPWGVMPACLPYIPLPAKLTMQVGAPMRFTREGPTAAGDKDYVNQCFAQVEHTLQDLLDGLVAERGFPVLG